MMAANIPWKKLHASLIVFGILFIGSLFAISIGKEESTELDTVFGFDRGSRYSCVRAYKNGHVEIIANVQDILLLELYSPPLGIETVGGVMTCLIPRNAFFPIKLSQLFTTYEDQQTTVSIKVYKGELNLTKDCRLLGTFDLSGISPAKRGTPEIEVTFEIDEKGILNVKAEDKASRKSENITINDYNGYRNQEIIDRMVREAEEFAKSLKEKTEARNMFETYVYNVKNQIDNKDEFLDKLESDEKKKIEEAINEAIGWLDENRDVEKEDYEKKNNEIEGVCNPIINSVYQIGWKK